MISLQKASLILNFLNLDLEHLLLGFHGDKGMNVWRLPPVETSHDSIPTSVSEARFQLGGNLNSDWTPAISKKKKQVKKPIELFFDAHFKGAVVYEVKTDEHSTCLMVGRPKGNERKKSNKTESKTKTEANSKTKSQSQSNDEPKNKSEVIPFGSVSWLHETSILTLQLNSGKKVSVKLRSHIGRQHKSRQEPSKQPSQDKILKKKQKLLSKLAEQKQELEDALRETTKKIQTQELQGSFGPATDLLYQNRKKLERKLTGHIKRYDELVLKESNRHRAGPKELPGESAHKTPRRDNKPGVIEALASVTAEKEETFEKGFLLKTGHRFRVGRNAKENLLILRQANPHHIWMHLRNYPGPHGIVSRNKSEELSQATLEEAAQILTQKNLAAKRDLRKGDRYEVIISEVRHIHPIKGKIGQVRLGPHKVLQIKL